MNKRRKEKKAGRRALARARRVMKATGTFSTVGKATKFRGRLHVEALSWRGPGYTDGEIIKMAIKDKLEKESHYSPPRRGKIEDVQGEKLNTLDESRFKAWTYIRKYKRRNEFLQSLYYQCRRKPLTEKQAGIAIHVAEKLIAHDKELDEGDALQDDLHKFKGEK